jgi:preprotein translocase subunit SecG
MNYQGGGVEGSFNSSSQSFFGERVMSAQMTMLFTLEGLRAFYA